VLAKQLDDGDCDTLNADLEKTTATADCPVSGGRIMTVMFCVQIGGMGLGQIGPALNSLVRRPCRLRPPRATAASAI
jgi:hypothetical protein